MVRDGAGIEGRLRMKRVRVEEGLQAWNGEMPLPTVGLGVLSRKYSSRYVAEIIAATFSASSESRRSATHPSSSNPSRRHCCSSSTPLTPRSPDQVSMHASRNRLALNPRKERPCLSARPSRLQPIAAHSSPLARPVRKILRKKTFWVSEAGPNCISVEAREVGRAIAHSCVTLDGPRALQPCRLCRLHPEPGIHFLALASFAGSSGHVLRWRPWGADPAVR